MNSELFENLPIGSYFKIDPTWTEVWQKTTNIPADIAYSGLHGIVIPVYYSNAKIVETGTICVVGEYEKVFPVTSVFQKFDFLKNLKS